MALVEDFDALLLDLDGTVWEGGHALDHAVDSINRSGLRSLYVTNNASRSAETVASMLRNIGLRAASDDVLTSAQAAVQLMATELEAEDPVLVLGADSLKELVERASFRVVASSEDAPKAVLHGHNPTTGWGELSEAALAIRAGARYLATNLDTSLPMDRGLMIGNGAMVAAVTASTGVVPVAAGKPEPAMFYQGAQLVNAQRPLAVGDRLDTDIAGACAAQMESLHVLTGVSGPWALVAAPASERPTFIGDDLRSLFEEADDLRPGQQGGFIASLSGQTVVLSGGDMGATPTQALRTVLAVCWGTDVLGLQVRAASNAAEAALDAWW